MLKARTIRQWKDLSRGVIGGPPFKILQSRLDKTCIGFLMRPNPTLVQSDKLDNSW